MDTILIILSALCLLVGLAGCILPMLPGPPLSYIGLLLLHFTDRVQFSVTELIVWAVLVVVTVVCDYLTPLIGVKFGKGSKAGNWGCIIGTVAGMFFLPWGILLGPFLGAVIGELIGGRPFGEALRAGFGAFLGFLVGAFIKIVICVYFIVCFFVGLF